MSRTDPQFNLRIRQELKSAIEDAANKNKRSATAEIIARLEATFELDALMSKRTLGDHNHTYLPSYISHLENRDEMLGALDLSNPASLEQMERMIEHVINQSLDKRGL